MRSLFAILWSRPRDQRTLYEILPSLFEDKRSLYAVSRKLCDIWRSPFQNKLSRCKMVRRSSEILLQRAWKLKTRDCQTIVNGKSQLCVRISSVDSKLFSERACPARFV